MLELQREKVITHLELSKRDADVAIMQLSQMIMANPQSVNCHGIFLFLSKCLVYVSLCSCAPVVRDALTQWQSYLARLVPVIDEHKVTRFFAYHVGVGCSHISVCHRLRLMIASSRFRMVET